MRKLFLFIAAALVSTSLLAADVYYIVCNKANVPLTAGMKNAEAQLLKVDGASVTSTTDISITTTGGEKAYYNSTSTAYSSLTNTSNFNTGSTSNRTMSCFQLGQNQNLTIKLGTTLPFTKLDVIYACSSTDPKQLSIGGTDYNTTDQDFHRAEITSGLSGDFVISNSTNKTYYVFAVLTATKTYTITYHCNGATSGCPENVDRATALPNPLAQPEKTDCDFVNWYTNEGLTDVAVAGATLSANADLYAKWQEAATKYDITYAYGDNTSATIPDAVNASNVTLTSIDSDNNYRFDGWKANVDVKQTYLDGTTITAGTLILAGTRVFVTQATAFTAQWTPKHAVSFNSNGGSDVATQYIVHGETAEEPVDPTRLNYDFEGWKLGNNDYDFATAVNEDIELDAQWSRKTISGDNDDIVIIDGTTINTGGTLSVVHYYSTSSANSHFKYGGAMKGTGSRVTKFTVPENKTAIVKEVTTHSTSTFVIIDESAVTGDYTTANTATFSYTNPYFSIAGAGSIANATKNTTMTAGDYFCGSTGSGLEISKLTITFSSDPIHVKFMVNGVKYDSIGTTTGEKLGNLFLDGELPTPEVQGYIFNGWKNAANDASVDKDTEVGAVSLVVYADLTEDKQTALDNTADEAKAVKRIVNGQIFIEKNGHVYNVLGGRVK